MTDVRDLISRMADELDYYRQLLTDDRREVHALAVEARAAALLEQRHPTPVPVSERLPGAEDCAPWPGEPDATPWAWAGKCVDDSWEWTQLSMLGMSSDIFARFIAGGGWTYWLPHHALPIPTP